MTLTATLMGTPQAWSQQIVANGTTQTASGTIDTGTLGPTAGYALYALNNGIITSSTPLTVITRGSAASGVYASGGGQITIASGSTVTTTGVSAYGLFGTGIGGTASTITATNTTISTAATSFYGVYATQGAVINLTGGSVTTGSGSQGLFAFLGNATINAINVAISTSGANGSGVQANLAGIINLTGGSVTTTGINAPGLYAIGTGATLSANGTVVQTTGNSAIGALVLQGQMTLRDVAVTTNGAGATGADVDNASSLTITGGSITTNGASAYGLLGTAGSTLTATNVAVRTTNTGSAGASAQFGAQLTMNGGSVTTTGDTAPGLFSVGVQGATGASLTANGVTVTTSGTSSQGATVRGGSSLTIANGSSITTTGSGSAALFSSAYDANPSTATVTNSTLQSVQDAGIRTSGTTLNASFTGSSLSGGAALLQTINGGTLNLTADSSTLTGMALTEISSGSISNVTLQNNTLWTMTGNSNVTNLTNNASTIQFTPPTGDPTQLASYKTLTAINYGGAGGTIGLNTFLGDDSSPSDRLVIKGGTASGSTSLIIHNTTGGGALTAGNGILVVDAQNGASTTAGAFALGNRAAAGAYEYLLFRGGPTNTDSWFLRSTLNVVPPEPPSPPEPVLPPEPQVPDYRVEDPVDMVVPALASRFGLTMLGTYHDRVGEDYIQQAAPAPLRPIWCKAPGQNCTPTAQPSAAYGEQHLAAWGRVFGQTGGVGSGGPDMLSSLARFSQSGPVYDFSLGGLQAGMDLYRRLNDNGSRDVAGFYVGGGRITANVQGVYGGAAGTTAMNGYSVGAYWTRTGVPGWYVDAVLQGTRYDQIRASSVLGETLSSDGWGFAASLEGGYPIALGYGFAVEPQAQLIYQHLTFSGGADHFGRIDFADTDALFGRLGARLTKNWSIAEGRPATLWASVNLWQGLTGTDARTTFSNLEGLNPVTLPTNLGGTWTQFGLGAAGEVTRNVSVFATADYSLATNQPGHSIGGRAGIKVVW